MADKERDIKIDNAFNKLLRYAPNALINLFAVLALGLLSVVTFGVDLAYVASGEFVFTSFALFVIFTLVHWSFYDGRVKAKRENEENKKHIKKYEDEIEHTTVTLEWQQNRMEFVSERNQREKIEAHKINVRNQLKDLKKKASLEDIQIDTKKITSLQKETLSEEKIKELELQYQKEKANNEYVKRKNELLEKLEKEWIVENIDKMLIDYNEIDIPFIENGAENETIKRDKVNKRGKYLKDNSFTRLSFFVLSFAVGAIATDSITDGGREAWALFAFRMVFVIFNLITGINYGDTFYKEYDLHNIHARVSIIREYKDWGTKKGFLIIKKNN